jgi:hypothetical protein
MNFEILDDPKEQQCRFRYLCADMETHLNCFGRRGHSGPQFIHSGGYNEPEEQKHWYECTDEEWAEIWDGVS